MRIARRLVLPVAVMLAQAGLLHAQPVPANRKEAVKSATEFVRLLVAGEYDKASAYFGGEMAEAMDGQKLRQVWAALEERYGPFKAVGPMDVVERFPSHCIRF